VRYNPTRHRHDRLCVQHCCGRTGEHEPAASMSATQAAGHSTLMINVPSNPPVVASIRPDDTYQKVEFRMAPIPQVRFRIIWHCPLSDPPATCLMRQSDRSRASRRTYPSKMGPLLSLLGCGLVAHGYNTGTRQWSTCNGVGRVHHGPEDGSD